MTEEDAEQGCAESVLRCLRTAIRSRDSSQQDLGACPIPRPRQSEPPTMKQQPAPPTEPVGPAGSEYVQCAQVLRPRPSPLQWAQSAGKSRGFLVALGTQAPSCGGRSPLGVHRQASMPGGGFLYRTG